MAENNYAALGAGLKLYTDALRRFLKERFVAAYHSNWWEAGVMKALTDTQKRSLEANLKRSPDRDKMDHMDATHLERLVTRNFDSALQGLFSDFRKTQSWLMRVSAARNESAHPRSGDMLADDVADALYAMTQILAAAKLKEAAAVEKIRNDVLGVDASAAHTAPREVSPAASGQLPYWWQVCEPHDAFKNPASVDESLFAATLGGVHAGSARPEYADPRIFFSHTYFTENLKQTIRDVASRMKGGDGPSVTEMQTPFGGGKTHALLTLYHLIKSPEESLSVPGVKEALGDVTIPPNARVLVFDGQERSAEPVTKENGASTFTLWGELAFQVDPKLFNTLLVASDSQGEAPGNAVFRQVLEAAAPCLIVIDELVSYLVKLKYSNARRTQNLYRQTIQFVQEMLQLAGNTSGICVLLSLPKSVKEFGGLDPIELEHQLAVMPDIQARVDRVASKRTPVNDDEIYTLTSKRLFQKVDAKAAEQAAHMYREAYERTRALYDPTVLSAEYLAQQKAAYPLHPELIDVLYKKWSTASDFPRTRAVLQLLANVVADQWVNRRDAYSIQSAHVDLERERIRTKIVSAAGSGGGYDAVVAADIIGGDAHADTQDQRRGADYLRHHVARGIATTILMHSFGGATRAGALPYEILLGTVAPNVGPEYVTEVMGSLEQSLWYVHRDGDLLRFQTRPNIYRIISQRAEAQPAVTVTERLGDEMVSAIGAADGFKVLDKAGASGVIAERPEPCVAVLDPQYSVSSDNGANAESAKRVEQLWDKVGGRLRQWRNALVLVAPDRELWARAEEAMREVLAYESIIPNAEKMDIDHLELKAIKSQFNDKKQSLRTAITTAYCWLFYPDESGLTSVKLPVPATASERIVNRAVTRLSSQDYGHPKVMDKIGAIYFNSKIAPGLWKDETNTLDLEDACRRFLEWTFLPLLPKRQQTLRDCVCEGVGLKLWAVVIGDSATSRYQKLIENPREVDMLTDLFDGSASLVKGDLLDIIRQELVKSEEAASEAPTTPQPAATGEKHEGRIAEKRPIIPAPPRRLLRARLQLNGLPVAKTSNLQPYLFKVLQEQDAGAEITLTIEVTSAAGIPANILDSRIVEGLEQLGIVVKWEGM